MSESEYETESDAEERDPDTTTAEVISVLDTPVAEAAFIRKKSVQIEQNDLTDTEEDDEDEESKQEKDVMERDPITTTADVISIHDTPAAVAASIGKKRVQNEQNDLTDTEDEDEDDESEQEEDVEERDPNTTTADVISIPDTPAAESASIR